VCIIIIRQKVTTYVREEVKTMKGARRDVKVCLIDDAKALAPYSTAPTVACGRCGVKANDAAVLCEPGLHSDVT
jgi:hypothetical protein